MLIKLENLSGQFGITQLGQIIYNKLGILFRREFVTNFIFVIKKEDKNLGLIWVCSEMYWPDLRDGIKGKKGTVAHKEYNLTGDGFVYWNLYACIGHDKKSQWKNATKHIADLLESITSNRNKIAIIFPPDFPVDEIQDFLEARPEEIFAFY